MRRKACASLRAGTGVPAPSSLPLAQSARHDISRPFLNPFWVSFHAFRGDRDHISLAIHLDLALDRLVELRCHGYSVEEVKGPAAVDKCKVRACRSCTSREANT